MIEVKIIKEQKTPCLCCGNIYHIAHLNKSFCSTKCSDKYLATFRKGIAGIK